MVGGRGWSWAGLDRHEIQRDSATFEVRDGTSRCPGLSGPSNNAKRYIMLLRYGSSDLWNAEGEHESVKELPGNMSARPLHCRLARAEQCQATSGNSTMAIANERSESKDFDVHVEIGMCICTVMIAW